MSDELVALHRAAVAADQHARALWLRYAQAILAAHPEARTVPQKKRMLRAEAWSPLKIERIIGSTAESFTRISSP